MNASKQATRHRKRASRRLVAVATAAVIAAGLLAAAVAALRPDHKAATGYAAAVPGAGSAGVRAIAHAGPTTPTRSATPLRSAPSSVAPHVSASASTAWPSATASTQAPPGAASLATRIKPGVTYQGVATEYSAGNGDGACLFGPAADMMIAAMNYTDYESSKACGAHILVRAANGASITVLITNECPLPCAPGQLDLSRQAFAKLAAANLGRIPITWTLVSPAGSATISIRYKTGSSRYWCGIQVIGHRNPVAFLEVRAADGWRQLPRTDYDYFLSADGTGCGGAVRITDIYGQQLVIEGIALSPDVVQPTGVQFAQH